MSVLSPSNVSAPSKVSAPSSISAPSNVTELPAAAGGAAGEIYSWEFNGTDEGVVISDVAALRDFFSGGGTIMAWIKLSGTPSVRGVIVGKLIAGGSDLGWYLTVESDLTIRLFHYFSGANAAAGSSLTVSENVWAHVAVVYDTDSPTSIAYYVNGTADPASPAPTGSAAGDATAPLDIAQNSNIASRNLPGRVYGAMMLPYAASSEQVTEHMALRTQSEYSDFDGALAAWTFGDDASDDATGTTGQLTDVTGNGYDGVPSNTVAGDKVEDAPA